MQSMCLPSNYPENESHLTPPPSAAGTDFILIKFRINFVMGPIHYFLGTRTARGKGLLGGSEENKSRLHLGLIIVF
jgi:hypothetical protein